MDNFRAQFLITSTKLTNFIRYHSRIRDVQAYHLHAITGISVGLGEVRCDCRLSRQEIKVAHISMGLGRNKDCQKNSEIQLIFHKLCRGQ